MSNPKDPWSRRPEEQSPGDQPTEGASAPTDPYGGASAPTDPGYTADPYQAYGEVPPTQAYPAYDYGNGNQPTEQYGAYHQEGYPQQPYGQQGYPQQDYGQGYPPPPNPTMAYPTYAQGQYSGEVPPLEQQPGGPKGSKTGLIVAGLVVVLLAAIAGVAFLLTGSDSADSSTQASGNAIPTPVVPPSTARPTPAPPSDSQLPSGLPAIPGLGDAFGEFGVAMGTITKNDGSTLEIKDVMGGATTTIRTDDNTEVVAPDGNKVADLKVGEQVAAQGEKNDDGTFHAKVLVSMTLPDLGDFGGFGGFGR